MIFNGSYAGERLGSEVSILTPRVNERFKGSPVNLVFSLTLEQINLGVVKVFGWFKVIGSYPWSINGIYPPPALVPETDLICASTVVLSLGVNTLNWGTTVSNW